MKQFLHKKRWASQDYIEMEAEDSDREVDDKATRS